MKPLINSLGPVFLLLVSASLVFAQKEEVQRLVLFQSEKPFPGKIPEYVAAQKEANEFATKYGYNLTVSVFQSVDGTFYFVSDIDNYAALDKRRELRSEVIRNAGTAELKKMIEAFRGIVDYNTSEIYLRGRYSYTPRGPGAKPVGMKFNRWTFYKLKPYYDEEGLQALLKEMRGFCEDNKVELGYDIYFKAFGGRNNQLLIVEGASTQADFYQANAEFNKKFAKKFRPIWMKFLTYVKDYHGIDCWYRPDLSLINEKTRESGK